jgi:cytochrome c oxidase accessory protein FixG
VACRQCVAVCPTGIDIRDGTQMECVNCTACIDACDSIMDKIGRPRGLIRFASQNNIERGDQQRFTKRMLLYTVVLTALVSLFLFLVFTRAAVETTILRAPGALFQQTADGKIENIYTVKVINKTSRDLPVELQLENLSGTLRVMSPGQFTVPKEKLAQTSVLIDLDPGQLTGPATKLLIGVYSSGKRLETVKTAFVGPR